MSMTYRQYLQYHANNHPSAAKRAEAQALLNVAGDDGNLDGNFLAGEKRHWWGGTKEKQSNGFNASTVNRNINPWWRRSYGEYQAGQKHSPDNPDQPAPPLNGGSGGGINARERDYTIGQIDEALGEYDHQLGMLNEQERIGRRDIEDGYNRNRSRLNTQHGRAMSRFATQESDNLRNFHESAEDNRMSARTNHHALQQMLGRVGAGRSSAAETLVPYAISQTASKQHGALSDDYALNARNIQTAKDETEEDYKHKVEDLGAQKNTSLRNLETDIAGKRSSIHREKGVLEGQKVQARGGNWQEAKNAMAGHKNTAQSLAASVNSLADKYRNPYSVQDVNVKKAELKNFSLDTAGISPSESERGHDTDTSARYLKQIEEEKKRKQQAGIYGY